VASGDLTAAQRDELESLMAGLRARLAADRTTLRIDFTGYRFPVVAESLSRAMHSIRGDETFDIRRAASSRAVLETREPLVQPDCLAHEHAPPPEFVTLYGVRAQILCPLVSDKRVVGIISVHSAEGPRPWSDADLTTVRAAAADAEQVLLTR
jgi:maleate isomerase